MQPHCILTPAWTWLRGRRVAGGAAGRGQFRSWPCSLDSALVGAAVPFLLLLSQARPGRLSTPRAQLSAPERAHGQQTASFVIS